METQQLQDRMHRITDNIVASIILTIAVGLLCILIPLSSRVDVAVFVELSLMLICLLLVLAIISIIYFRL